MNQIISRDVYCLYVSSFLTCHIAILALQKKSHLLFCFEKQNVYFWFFEKKTCSKFSVMSFLVLKYICTTTARVRLRTWIIFHNSLHIPEEITKMKSMKIYKCMIWIFRRILLLHILSLHITTFLSRYANNCVCAY